MAVKKAALACTVCGSRNYSIAASKNRTQRLELKKFCKHCGKQTLHKETQCLSLLRVLTKLWQKYHGLHGNKIDVIQVL